MFSISFPATRRVWLENSSKGLNMFSGLFQKAARSCFYILFIYCLGCQKPVPVGSKATLLAPLTLLWREYPSSQPDKMAMKSSAATIKVTFRTFILILLNKLYKYSFNIYDQISPTCSANFTFKIKLVVSGPAELVLSQFN